RTREVDGRLVAVELAVDREVRADAVRPGLDGLAKTVEAADVDVDVILAAGHRGGAAEGAARCRVGDDDGARDEPADELDAVVAVGVRDGYGRTVDGDADRRDAVEDAVDVHVLPAARLERLGDRVDRV